MPILTVVIVLVVVGLILWLINNYIPLQPPFKTVINVLVIVFLIVWLLKILGVFSSMSSVRV